MIPDSPKPEQCSICLKKRAIVMDSRTDLSWCRFCSTRRQLYHIIRDVPENALAELLEALQPLKKLSPDDESGFPAIRVQRLRDEGLIR